MVTTTTTPRAAAVFRPALLALACLAALIAVAPLRHEGAIAPIDYREQLAEARAKAPYHVLAPDRLPPGWVATRAAYDPDAAGAATWHLAVLTATGRYAGVAQSNGESTLFVIKQSNRGRPDGDLTIGGQVWHRLYREDRDIRTLVRTTQGVATVVSGNTSYDDLEALARSLR